MKNKIVILGGEGFLASHLVDLSISKKLNVVVYDTKIGSKKKIKNVKFVQGDILDKKKLEKLINKGDVVYHFAAVSDLDEANKKHLKSIEVNRFIAISPQPNIYDFSFLSPCPSSGLMVSGKKDELVPLDYINELNKRLSAQKGIKVEFQFIPEANHFFTNAEENLLKVLKKYIKQETTLF